ncbi:MAG: hypothetical protein AAGA30_16695 [Planctomycetota bacterium]
MVIFIPQIVPKPVDFDRAQFDAQASNAVSGSRSFAEKYNYSYVATHHLCYSLLEHDFALQKVLFRNFDIPLIEFRTKMLELLPPENNARPFNLPTTKQLWNVYMNASTFARSKNRFANVEDLFNGLIRHREKTVDSLFAYFGVRITSQFTLEDLNS